MLRYIDYFVNKSHIKGIIFFFKKIWTKCNELVLNIDTMSDNPFNGSVNADSPYMQDMQDGFSKKPTYQDNKQYNSLDYWNIRKVARFLKPSAECNDVFYDLGSGKGRVLCVNH